MTELIIAIFCFLSILVISLAIVLMAYFKNEYDYQISKIDEEEYLE